MLNILIIILCIFAFIKADMRTGDKSNILAARIASILFIGLSIILYIIEIPLWISMIIFTIGISGLKTRYIKGYKEEEI